MDSAARLALSAMIEQYRRKATSPVDVCNAYLARIRRYNPALNAFLEVGSSRAQQLASASAKRWQNAAPLSAIDGIPFGIKANFAVSGLSWHGGIAAYRNRKATHDAALVLCLLDAGAVPLGILNMDEGALGVTTSNPYFGQCCNPWGEGITPGGSSGGSAAAVAAGLCPFAIGTDTLGSIRIPAAFCGVSGLKPSYGALPLDGVIPLSPTLDHAGILARTAEDLSLVHSALFGAEKLAPLRLRFGLVDWSKKVDGEPGVISALTDAEKIVREVGEVTHVDAYGFNFGALRRSALLVTEVEAYKYYKEVLTDAPAGFSKGFRKLLQWGSNQPSEKIEAARTKMNEARTQLDALFEEIDILVLPVTPHGPISLHGEHPENTADLTCLANIAGSPALAVPAVRHGEPPVFIQFMAPQAKDGLAVFAAVQFEKKRGPAPAPPTFFE